MENEIKLTTSRGGSTRTFVSADEFVKWLKDEVGNWQWLTQARAAAPMIKPVVNPQLNTLTQLVNEQEAQAGSDVTRRLQVAIAGSAALSEHVLQGKLLTSEDIHGQLILKIARDRPIAAAFALAYILGISVQDLEHAREAFYGRLCVALTEPYAAAQTERLQTAAIAVLSQLNTEQRTALSSLESEGLKLTSELQASIELARRQTTEEAARASKTHEEQAGEFSKQLEQQRSEFESLKIAFNEHMKLKAPVAYWRSSKWWHRSTALAFGILSVVWGIIVGVNALNYGKQLLDVRSIAPTVIATPAVHQSPPQQAQGPQQPAQVAQQPAPYWQIGLFLLLVTLAIWLLRVLVRVTLSNLHQASDAASRATMTEAYLALIADGKGLPEKDRILVLSTIFRPMSTGLIKDDGMPPSVIELLSRVVGGSGK